MPEVAEIRVVSDELREKLSGRQILSYTHSNKAKITGFDLLDDFPITIMTVRSHGKKIIFELDNHCLMIGSLGMTGRFQYEEGKHTHVTFELDDGKLYYCDPRNFGGIDVIAKEKEQKYFINIGPCLLTHALRGEDGWISSDEWYKLYKPKLMKKKIYDILMDQSIVSGIGNYLQSEILYYSHIHPLRIGSSITKEELEIIRVCAHKIALVSYSYGGLTIADYISPCGKLGEYPAAIYGKTHDPNGFKVIKQKATQAKGSRSIHHVMEIQKL